MQTQYHLLLDRSEYTTEKIEDLEILLRDWAISEGETKWIKTNILPITEVQKSTIEEVWIEDGKYNGEDVSFVHFYNEFLYIIQTN